MRLDHRFHRAAGVAVGVAGVALVTAVFAPFGAAVPDAVPALLLVVPIAGSSVMSGWRVGVPLAIVAAAVFALAFIPPIGEIRIGLTEDVYVLVTFILVAVVVSVLAARAKQQAGRSFDGRTVLLHGVSHDLRSPLTTIKTISSDLMMDDAAYDDGTRHEMLGRVVEESDRLNRIVGNLLSASRVQAGALNPQCEPESIILLVNRSVARLGRTESANIVTDIPPGLPDVFVDAVQVDQVLTNLIENARRHAPVGTHVTVAARTNRSYVEVEVSDTGPGFTAGALDHLFRPFHSGAGDGAVGLGLSVSKAIVEAHGGTIGVRDEADHRGATVTFTLPVHATVDAGPRR